MNKKIGTIALVIVFAGAICLAGYGINRRIYNLRADRLCLKADALLEQRDYPGAIKRYESLLKDFSRSGAASKAQIGLAQAYLESGQLLEARDTYKNLLTQDLDIDFAKQARDKLSGLNIRILESSIKTPDSIIYRVQEQDTLQGIAQKYNVTVALLKKANNLKSVIIRPGMELKIGRANFGIVVDKSRNVLTLKSGEEVIKVYPVSTGADNSTPTGVFKIVSKIVDPPWFSGGKAIPPGDPKNILGTRWMGITAKGYGIHGTTDDASIGKQCTQGCVRMRNSDVEELYDIVPQGAEVTIVN